MVIWPVNKWGSDPNSKYGLWGNGSDSGYLLLSSRECSGQGELSDISTDPILHIASGNLAKVFQSHINTRDMPSLLIRQFNVFNMEVGSQLPFKSVRGFLSGISGLLSDNQLSLHVSGLLSSRVLGVFSQPVSFSPQSSRIQGQEEGNYSQGDRGSSQPPIQRRFFFFLFSFSLGYVLSVWGWENIDNQRIVMGAAQIFIGSILSVSGFALLLLIGFRGSWGWWL